MGMPPHRPWNDGADPDGEPDDGLLGFEGYPDASTGRHASPDERPGRLAGMLSAAGLPVVALGVALLASVMAVLSLMVGMLAVSRSDDAPDVEPVAAATSDPPEVVAPPQAVVPSPPPTSASPSPSPSPRYPPVYVEQLISVQRSTCDGTPVDLDEPRVLPTAGADLTYRNCDDGPHVDLDAMARFAVVDVPTATAQDCMDAIRLNPGLGWITPDPNVTVCALTSPMTARMQNVTPKLVRLHVDSIDAQGTLLLTLTAWTVPTVP
jgi:hypothetical protein